MMYNMGKNRHVLTAAQAKSHLASALREVEKGGVVVVTRYGAPVAALVSIEELEQLDRLRARSNDQGLAGLHRRWNDGDELVSQLDSLVRDREPRPPFRPGRSAN